jgi:3-methyladenine DNA glycosylase AlkD
MNVRSVKALAAEIEQSLAALPRRNAPSFRILRRAWSKRLREERGTTILALAQELVPRGFWERVFAYEIIVNHRRAREALRPHSVRRLGRGIQSWGEVDTFAGYVAGPAWREHRIPDSLIKHWARSRDRWWRRAALVTTVPLNRPVRGGAGDASRTLKICRMLVRDRDDMVVKALSWALRELSKRDRTSVELFLITYQEVLPARVNREVRNKLRTGLKNPRMKKDEP